MLDQHTISIVKATAPILKENGEKLTSHFYKRMFTNNPEVKPFFNFTNQESGTQHRALASAICSYAANIDNLEVLGSAVEVIAHKHASLRVKSEHYPIVGKNLLLAIKDILGDTATDEVINAWGKAYTVLADILINKEGSIYQTQQQTKGGWEDFKHFKVVKKEQESSVITSFYLKPEDGTKPPQHKPGQYITIRVPSPYGHTTMRNYSLSSQPGQDYFRISVKREEPKNTDAPAGYVSNLLHSNVAVGDLLEIAPPCGEFFLDPTQKRRYPLVLIGAGVGITPILSMLLSILKVEHNEKIYFIQACLDENHQAFHKTIDDLAREHHNLEVHYRYSEPAPTGIKRKISSSISQGLVDPIFLDSILDYREAEYYFCGPKPFMASIYATLVSWGISNDNIHFEFFGPREEIENLEPIASVV